MRSQSGISWSEQEEEILRSEYGIASLGSLAERLGRSVSAVKSRARRIGVRGNPGVRPTHGATKSPEHMAWCAMRSRCRDSDSQSYDNYGGRGIAVCERWLKFENFLADMGPRPTPKHSIDRINNDGNYEPANCRWATKYQQDNNRRTNRMLEYAGLCLTISEWSRRVNISWSAIDTRLERGWSVEEALTVRPRRSNRIRKGTPSN